MRLFDFIEREKWQRIENGFSRTLGVSIQTVDTDGNSLSETKSQPLFCADIVKLSPENNEEYKTCITRLIEQINKDRDHCYIVCSFGLYLYCIPVEIKKGVALAYIILGPAMLQKQREVSEYKKIAEEKNIPLEYLMDKLANFRRFTFVGLESAVELLYEVSHCIAELSWNTKRLQERFEMSDALNNMTKELYESAYFEELLNALLDTSITTTKADTGSIMLLDQDNSELSIKFSRGIKDDIVKSSRVRLGEGLSGLVAKDRRPLFIDDSMNDAIIKKRMKRPEIKSSIIYPIEVQNNLLGVINVNSTGKNSTFDSETLDLVGNFTRLTKIALNMFSKKQTLSDF